MKETSHDRVEWAYLRRRSWAEGLSKAAVAQLVGSDDALSTERDYVAKVLPTAVVRELRQRHITSAAAVVAALAWTTAGYVRWLSTTGRSRASSTTGPA